MSTQLQKGALNDTTFEYVKAVKRALRDQHGFEPLPGSTKQDPLLVIPDGTYPVLVCARYDYVVIKGGIIDYHNFKD